MPRRSYYSPSRSRSRKASARLRAASKMASLQALRQSLSPSYGSMAQMAQASASPRILSSSASRSASARASGMPVAALLNRVSLSGPYGMFTEEELKNIRDTKKMFQNMPLSTEHLLRLYQFKNEVMPVKYHTCPVGWKEYKKAEDSAFRAAKVMWMNDKGNYCLPQGQTEGVSAADEVSAISDAPTTLSGLYDEIKDLNEQLQLTLDPEGAEAKKIRDRKSKQERAAAAAKTQAERRQEILANSKSAAAAKAKPEQIRKLKTILKRMKEYKNLSSADLNDLAERYYSESLACAKNHNKEDACSQNSTCSFEFGNVCVPKTLSSVVDEELADVEQEEVSGYASSTASAEHAAAEDLAAWWKNFYTAQSTEGRSNTMRSYEKSLRKRALLSPVA